MKIKTVTVSNLPSMTFELSRSMIKYNIDNEIIYCDWEGFYTKISETYNFCKTLKGYDYILFVDAHDVIFKGDIKTIIEKINTFPEHDCIFSTEKACWPNTELALKYKKSPYPWNYLNSGSYLFKIDKFLQIIEENKPFIGMDDQLYFTELYLDNKINCILDVECKIFQSVAFEDNNDFSIENGVIKNNITNSFPIVIHGNGKTDLTKFI